MTSPCYTIDLNNLTLSLDGKVIHQEQPGFGEREGLRMAIDELQISESERKMLLKQVGSSSAELRFWAQRA